MRDSPQMFNICNKRAILWRIAFIQPQTTLSKVATELFAECNQLYFWRSGRIQVSALSQSFCRLPADVWSDGFQVCPGAGVQWRDWATQRGAGTRKRLFNLSYLNFNSCQTVSWHAFAAVGELGVRAQTFGRQKDKSALSCCTSHALPPQKWITTNRDTHAREVLMFLHFENLN